LAIDAKFALRSRLPLCGRLRTLGHDSRNRSDQILQGPAVERYRGDHSTIHRRRDGRVGGIHAQTAGIDLHRLAYCPDLQLDEQISTVSAVERDPGYLRRSKADTLNLQHVISRVDPRQQEVALAVGYRIVLCPGICIQQSNASMRNTGLRGVLHSAEDCGGARLSPGHERPTENQKKRY
jgi:hypothetical protein